MWLLMTSVAAIMLATEAIPCEQAHLKCAYRVGCGSALQRYLVSCSPALQGSPSKCPERCQHALIALTSTEEGKAFMNCECSDEYCESQKLRIDVCRPSVMELMNKPIVSCTVAQWICTADALCSTALDYYNRLCKSMFHGKKCTPRCRNSINILKRQDKAAKLTTCKCDGLEDYDCHGIRRNMDKLCFHKHKPQHHHHHHPPHHRNTSETHILHKEEEEEEVIPSVVLASSSGTKVTISALVIVVLFALFT